MIELELNYLRKIRIWFEKNNYLTLSGNNFDVRKYASFLNDKIINTTVIVELFIPRGGRNLYGLLGVDYFPSVSAASNDIEVKVWSGNIIKPKVLNNSFLGRIAPVYLCLPDEFRSSIFKEIEEVSNNNKLHINGSLGFRYGAFSEVSSSEWIFRKLVKLIINLIHIPEHEIIADALEKLIDE